MSCSYDIVSPYVGPKVAGYLVAALVGLGGLTVLCLVWRILKFWVLRGFRGSSLGKYKIDGAWAVVTGSTDGIGKSFALGLAKKGFNIVLVSRTEARLQETKKEIDATGVKCEYVSLDCANAKAADYARLAKAVEDKNVTVLVNNVGMGYDFPMFFDEVDENRVDDLVNVNITATNKITRIVLPIMKKLKRGLVLSISSGSSLQPSPLLAVYAGTKAYVNTWSESCNGEYSRLGIRFECLAPFWVTSKLSKIRKSSLTTPNPDTYVRSALGMIGNEKLHTGFFWHEVFAWMGAVMSQLGFGDSYVFNMHNAIRKRGMAKRTEKKE